MKGGTADDVFKEQCFLWERGASVFAFYKTLKEMEKKKKTWKRIKDPG